MDGWNSSFLLGWPIFRGYVSFREGKIWRLPVWMEKNPTNLWFKKKHVFVWEIHPGASSLNAGMACEHMRVTQRCWNTAPDSLQISGCLTRSFRSCWVGKDSLDDQRRDVCYNDKRLPRCMRSNMPIGSMGLVYLPTWMVDWLLVDFLW